MESKDLSRWVRKLTLRGSGGCAFGNLYAELCWYYDVPTWQIWPSLVSSNWLMNLQVGCLDVIGTGDYMYTIRPPTAHHELAIITWSQVTQSPEWMERPENSSKGQSDVCPLRTQLHNSKVKSWKLKFQSLLSVKSIWCDFLTLSSSSKICHVVCDVKVIREVFWFFLCIILPYSMCPCVSYTSWLCLTRIHTNKHWQNIASRKHRQTSKYWQICGDTLRESTN